MGPPRVLGRRHGPTILSCIAVLLHRRLVTEIRCGNVATDLMARLGTAMERRLFPFAYATELARTARVEDAAVRHMDGARNLPDQARAQLDLLAQAQVRREQGGRIRMMGPGEDALGRP